MHFFYNKAVLEPRVSPAFAITYFSNHCNIRFENTSKYVNTLTLFPKTWTKGHWSLDDLWPHVCWGHMCDSTQGSLCPSPMTIHQCMLIQWSILQNNTYIHIHTYILHTTYWMSDHIVSYWTQFRRDKNVIKHTSHPFVCVKILINSNIRSLLTCSSTKYRDSRFLACLENRLTLAPKTSQVIIRSHCYMIMTRITSCKMKILSVDWHALLHRLMMPFNWQV